MNRPQTAAWLTVESLDQELVIYHPGTKQALCLDPVTTRVFRLCDGSRTPHEIAREVGDEAYRALELLAEHHLLLEPAQLDRRHFLKTAAAMVPAILAVTAPEPAMAQSQLSCVNASACNDPGVVASCPGCDPANPPGGPDPAACAIQNCLQFYHIGTNSDGSVITSPNCAGDSTVPAVTCELTRPGDFWQKDCETSRNKVIAQWIAGGSVPGALSNYKCCPGCCVTPCP